MVSKDTMGKVLFAVVASILFVYVVITHPYNDPDSYCHVTLGQYMIQHHTIVKNAIYSFVKGGNLPYVPHEVGYQIIAALFYNALGWYGVHILATICLGLLIAGMYRLAKVSRVEMGYDNFHPFAIS